MFRHSFFSDYIVGWSQQIRGEIDHTRNDSELSTLTIEQIFPAIEPSKRDSEYSRLSNNPELVNQ